MCTGIKKNEKKESKQINEDLAFHSDFGRLYYLLNEKKGSAEQTEHHTRAMPYQTNDFFLFACACM